MNLNIMVSVIIATNGRATELKECLWSLGRQSLLSDEIIIADGGSDLETEKLVKDLAGKGCGADIKYYNFGPLGAAGQRNKGAEKARGDILFFLDDDIVCEPDFIRETIAVFKKDAKNETGGVSGTIVNQTYAPLSSINRMLFNLCVEKEERDSDYGGRLVGPAVNFLPVDKPGIEQQVDWIPSGCSAYRRDIFLEHKFNETFLGYSFIEDVELSSRVKEKFKLINTTRARCFHRDLGRKTHKNWVKIGKMQVLNRWYVMTKVLQKSKAKDKIRFLYYQFYCLIAESKFLLGWPDAKDALLRWWGRLLGMFALLIGG